MIRHSIPVVFVYCRGHFSVSPTLATLLEHLTLRYLCHPVLLALYHVFCQLVFLNVMWARGKTRVEACEGNEDMYLERGTHVPDGEIPQREEVDMVWTCAKAR